jgi:hypothetical protein
VGGGHGPTNHLAPLFTSEEGRAAMSPEGWNKVG